MSVKGVYIVETTDSSHQLAKQSSNMNKTLTPDSLKGSDQPYKTFSR